MVTWLREKTAYMHKSICIKKYCCFYTCFHVETLQQLNYVVFFLFEHKNIYRRNVFCQQNKVKKQRMIDWIDDESHVSSQFWNTLNRKNKREKCAQMCSMWLYFIDALFIVGTSLSKCFSSTVLISMRFVYMSDVLFKFSY